MDEPQQVAAEPITGEPVWDEAHCKEVSVEFDADVGVESAYLGRADRPSEVARLFRQAAVDTEFAIRQALESQAL